MSAGGGPAAIWARRALLCTALGAIAALTVLLVSTPTTPAAGDGVTTATVSIAEPVDRSCSQRPLHDVAGADSIGVSAPELGSASFATVEARLEGSPGSDWDLAVFDAASRRVVAASAFSGARETASGYLGGESGLVVQACRLAGAGSAARLSITTTPVEASGIERSSLATVETPTRVDKQALSSLGLDLTEHGGRDYVAVVLHGAGDRRALDKAGLDYEVEVPDLARQSARQNARNAEYARQTRVSSLPSGRDTYRRLFEYSQELKDLADANPDLVRPITLNHQTYEARPVEGIEITTDPNELRDGKPVFLQMGLHHAREWPSGEHALEWAYELINGYRAGDVRVRSLVEKTRTIVIPVVNPDGFNASREAGQAQGAANGRDGNDIVNFTNSPNEYRRKNCRFVDDSEGGSCSQPSVGLEEPGVDPNRNYGGFWGGPGASDVSVDQDYRGPGPFSEPETQNIRELVSTRQVTALITNHTFSNLVLRPPGLSSQPDPIDEPIYKALGDAMAAENGYLSLKGYELYDTSGTTEDWTYNATGGLGFTFEIYCNHIPDPTDPRCTGNFHPTFANMVAEYDGTSPDAQAIGGGGNREAYFLAHEAAADPARHSVLEGSAPPGAVLKLEKTFQTPTMVDDPASFEDHLETEMVVPDSGRFEYHVNPSTRPLVAQSTGRNPLGSPSSEQAFSGDNTTTVPPVGCLSADTTDPNCWNDHPFTIDGSSGVDNDKATVAIEWLSPANDYDMKVFRDTDADGTSTVPDGPDPGSEPDSEPESAQVGQSAQGTTSQESTTFIRPEASDGRLEPGPYVVRVINYSVAAPPVDPYDGTISFEGPDPFQPGTTETWRLTCTFRQRTATQEVLIGRGERKTLDLSACAPRCKGQAATRVGTKRRDQINGTAKRDVIVGLGGRDRIRGRGGNDRICGKGGRDRLIGGAGRDRVNGNSGKDRVSGSKGKDRLGGGKGKDRLRGGGGPDRLLGGRGTDLCLGGRGRDVLRNCEL